LSDETNEVHVSYLIKHLSERVLVGEIVGKKTCFMLSPFTVVGKSGTKGSLVDTSTKKEMNVKWFCLQ